MSKDKIAETMCAGCMPSPKPQENRIEEYVSMLRDREKVQEIIKEAREELEKKYSKIKKTKSENKNIIEKIK